MYGRSESEQTLIGGETGRESQMYADDGVTDEVEYPSSKIPPPIGVVPVTAIVLPRCSLLPADPEPPAPERPDAEDDDVPGLLAECLCKLPVRNAPSAPAAVPCCSWEECSEPMVNQRKEESTGKKGFHG